MEPQTPSCPVCRGQSLRPYFRIRGWAFARCRGCGHRFGLAEGGGPAAPEELYQEGEYAGFREDRVFQAAVRERVRADFVPRLPPGAKVLDVGCGNGEFLAAAAEAGFEAHGIDLSEAAAQMCRARGLRAVSGDFLTAALDAPFDAITMWDVIEHLPDPVSFVRRAAGLLRPGGVLVMKTPFVGDSAFRFLALVPRLAGPVLQAPAHIQFFTPRSMELLGRNGGFGRVEQRRLGGMRDSGTPASLARRVRRKLYWSIRRASGNYQMYTWMTAPAQPPAGRLAEAGDAWREGASA